MVAGGEHNVLDEHPGVHPRAFLENRIDEKKHGNWRAEVVVILYPLPLALLYVFALDTERGVEGVGAGVFA